MKKISVYLLSLCVFSVGFSRPIENMQHRVSKPTLDKRAGAFANTCDPASQSVDLDVNNVRTKLLNGGDMWWDLNNPKYEIPKVTDPNAVRKHSLFAGAIWIGGKDNGGNLKLAAMTYRQGGNDFWPGPLDTTTASADPIRCKNYDKMWKVTRDELEEFENSKYLTQSAGIRDWPAGDSRGTRFGNEADYMAPYKEVVPDHTYNPFDGEHPVLDERKPASENGVDRQPDMFIWWVFNDKGNIHGTQGQPIGVECQTTAFAFATNDEVNNMTFYTTKIINRGFTTLNNCYMGQWVDPDLGNYSDDYVGCDVARKLGYCYNGDDDDEGVLGYGLNPPSIGVNYFEGPTDTSGKQMGLSHFMYYNNSSDPVTGDPMVANQYYNYMMGKWKGGQNVTWGGNGYGGSRPCNYMFPGCTDPAFAGECWDERSAGNRPGDRRFIQSTGPFLLRPGQVQRITVGVVWARTTSGGATGSLSLLKLASDKAQTLFNNNFKILDGPNAPDAEIQELDQQLVLKFLDINSPKVENYREIYKDAQNKSKTYKFEGYLVYQLKDATVNTGDLDNIDKARLLFQCDIKNNRGQIINKVFDPKLSQLIPVEKVDGADKGLQHTFNIQNDLFATTANTTLVNFKKYYYMVMSYAILSDDTLQVDPNQFLAGRRNIKVYSAVPHNPLPEGDDNSGTQLNAGYGSGPSLTRISGRGNGGNVLEFTTETIDSILNYNYVSRPKYIGGSGPVKVKVVDPFKVPNSKFELIFKENKPSLAIGKRDSITKNTSWILVRQDDKNGNDTIFSDTTLAYRFESVQGKKGLNNGNKLATLADWGLSIELAQVYNPGENALADPTNGVIDYKVEWEDNGKQWLTAFADNDAAGVANNPNLWMNWIRSGTAGKGATFDPYIHDYYNADGSAMDPSGAFEKIWGGRIAPYAMAARAPYSATNGENTYGFAFSTSASGLVNALSNPLAELHSFQLVITKDKTKWTRCPVIEMGDDEVVSMTEGKVNKFNMRKGTSKSKDGADESSTGLSWFPGYCINLETGERLQIAFGEDSYLSGEKGRDMMWNPTDVIFNDNQNYPAIGGKHFIYIFGTGLSTPSRNVVGDRYRGSDDANFARFRTGMDNPTALDKRNLYSQVTWLIPTYCAPGYASQFDGMVPPTDVKITVRVQKAYNIFKYNSSDPNEVVPPKYTFDGAELAPTHGGTVQKKSLDMANIVPNPYRGYSEYENSPIDSRVKITNLPQKCTISIFDMAGNLIRKVNKDDENTYYQWDLKNNSNVPIASGLYLIHIKAPNIGEKVIRWYGIMHAIDLDTY